jgi:hypothetical protein
MVVPLPLLSVIVPPRPPALAAEASIVPVLVIVPVCEMRLTVPPRVLPMERMVPLLEIAPLSAVR